MAEGIVTRLPHKVFDLLLWLHETRPEIAREEEGARAELPKPDALHALNKAWRDGIFSEAEYQERYDQLNRQHGEWCACGRGQVIHVQMDGSHVCGACAMEAIG